MWFYSGESSTTVYQTETTVLNLWYEQEVIGK